MVAIENAGEGRQQRVQQFRQLGRLQTLGHGSEIVHVAEHHAHFPRLRGHPEALRIAADFLDQLGWDVLSENVDKLLFLLGFREVAEQHVDHEKQQNGEQ